MEEITELPIISDNSRRKSGHVAIAAAYLAFLLWLILFKTSLDILAILAHHTRSINVVPFAGESRGILGNTIVFIPLGLLLPAIFKRVNFWRKLASMAALSVCLELIQFALAIGVTDITDVLTNTFGGFLGLAIYGALSRYIASEKLDRFVAIITTVLLVAFLLLRFFVFRVRY